MANVRKNPVSFTILPSSKITFKQRTFSPWKASCKPIFNEYKILTVPSLIIFKTLSTVQSNYDNLFNENHKHNHNTRYKTNFQYPKHQLKVVEKTSSYMGKNCFNKFPLRFKELIYLGAFQDNIKELLLGKIYYNDLLPDHKLSCAPKQVAVYCDSKVIHVTLMPQDDESFYACIAHHLFGPFRSVSELTATANSVRASAIRFIQRNKNKFQKDVEDFYVKIYPGHSFTSDVAFDQCCVYLLDYGHSSQGIHLTAHAIATLYCRTIVIMSEKGQAPITFSPLYTVSGDPITMIERRNLDIHFDAVDQCEEIDYDATPRPVTPNLNVQYELLIATWQMRDCSTTELQNKVDDILMTCNIDLICIQAIFPSKFHFSTAHYNWWCVINMNATGKEKCRGIGFLLHNSYKGILSDFTSYSEDLAVAVLTVNGHKFNIIGCHLPDLKHKQYPRVTSDILSAFKLSLKSPDRLILLGQFNARIGKSDEEPNQNIGPQLIHENFNQSGRLLKKLAVGHDLQITSTYSCENSPTSATYKYPDTDKLLQISHILLQNKDQQTTRNFRWWNPLSHHAIVGCKIVSHLNHVPASA